MAKPTRSERKKTNAQIAKEIEFFLSDTGKPRAPLRYKRGGTRFQPMIYPGGETYPGRGISVTGVGIIDRQSGKRAVQILTKRYPAQTRDYIARAIAGYQLGNPKRTTRDLVARFEEIEYDRKRRGI